MGGRGGAGGGTSATKNNIRTVQGVSVGSRLFAKESDVAKLSQNTIWVENTSTPHAVLKTVKEQFKCKVIKRTNTASSKM